MTPLRILLVDFAGHPFQAELSRAMAARGHTVRHVYAGHLAGPKGSLRTMDGDPTGLAFAPLGSARFWRSFLVGRLAVGLGFGWALRQEIRRYCPEVVIVSNTPPEALVVAGFGRYPRAWIWWVQDLLAPGAEQMLGRRSAILARTVGNLFGRLESWLARKAHAIVLISDAFKAYIDDSCYGKVTVLHNWAPVHELPVREKSNAWARRLGLSESFNFIYTGTIGMKHNPELLIELARTFVPDSGVRVIVASEGPGAAFVRSKAEELGLSHLLVLPFQPYELLPDVMGAADVLVALLAADAGAFSVPSKILSYFCAGRPILASLPADNLASELLRSGNFGVVVRADDIGGFLSQALRLSREDPASLRAMGAAARRFAEREFDIDGIADRFEGLMPYPAGQGSSGLARDPHD